MGKLFWISICAAIATTIAVSLGLIFICGGVAMWLDVSFLIASMTMGIVITNFAHHHTRQFHEIENIEWPFLVIFFVLAGASLELAALKEIGMIGPVCTRLAINQTQDVRII